ncbi:Similar to Adamts16: A disintegrin and metalloproteinase with thrombospondin motifs 16 (Mus musculus) [Cotesia congregata]|uniref:Similar to Adamts16: A disintegrin and metalloproteinase with thrombospondin motifs 16 (Mus musculus) n=1 Tax=Cotesia congregata TaxID=51543 RepID=A0A8J2MSN0_COTCN|nr:Similar to Adamts16: A disintegrin and metalloproteinase with thrombospondin motifs 16 (Mus musculus) [Cotesia congregata]
MCDDENFKIVTNHIHHEFTNEELRSVFQASRNAVPYYEVVPVAHNFHVRDFNEGPTVKINSFDQNLKMYLSPSDAFLVSENTPVWTAQPDKNSLNGVKYRKVKDPFNDVGQAYQDAQTNSAVVIYRSSRRIVERKRKSPLNRNKRSLPDVIYPQVLAILDSTLYQILNKDYKTAILYLLSFWNAVDLRYRTISNPKVRINVAGFIISVSEGGTPYLENNRRGDIELDADLALIDMSHYFYKETRFPFETYDMAVALTNYDICNVEYGYCDPSTLGYAFEMGACNRSSIDRNTEAVGIVEDNGGYGAILPAAHEVGHLAGVPHDGTEEASDCSGLDGYIMTPTVTFGHNSFHWSKCSKKLMDDFFAMSDASCLFDQPRRSKQIPLMLPGKIQTLDQQCQKVYGTKACFYDERVCTKLECQIPRGGGSCKSISSAAEGSKCGEGMFCIRGNCIAENSTTVPNWEKKKPEPNQFWDNFHPGPSTIKIN